jgi:uncharacterized membrane protein (DUF373 family)
MEAPDDGRARGDRRWTRVLKGFERIIILVMTGLLMIVITISTVELGWLLLRDLASFRGLLIDVAEMFELFGFFLIILIGVELLSTLKVYVREGAVHMEVVLEVALIAIAQKVIVLDTTRAGPLSLLGLAALVLALAAAYWWVRSARTAS